MNERQHNRIRERLIHLVTSEKRSSSWGEARPLTTWYLKAHLSRCPLCAREWKELQTLTRDLAALPAPTPARPAPHWPAIERPNGAERRSPARNFVSLTRALGGFAMKHRTAAFAAASALTLMTVSGVYAARQWHFDLFQYLSAGKTALWTARPHFRGEVRFRTPDGKNRGSVSSSESDAANALVPTAEFEVNGYRYHLQGMGLHAIISPRGEDLGTAEIVPQSDAERLAWQQKHDRDNGIEEPLHISYGSVGGYGKAYGFFGEESKRLTWKFHGVGIVHFHHADTGRQAYAVHASPVNEAIRLEQWKSLSAEEYARTVSEGLPEQPVFTWTLNGQTHSFTGGGPQSITLPNGKELLVSITPLEP